MSRKRPPLPKVLTAAWLKKECNACERGVWWFDKTFPNGLPLTPESLIPLLVKPDWRNSGYYRWIFEYLRVPGTKKAISRWRDHRDLRSQQLKMVQDCCASDSVRWTQANEALQFYANVESYKELVEALVLAAIRWLS